MESVTLRQQMITNIESVLQDALSGKRYWPEIVRRIMESGLSPTQMTEALKEAKKRYEEER